MIVHMKPILDHASEYSQSQVREVNDSLLVVFGQILDLERWHLTMYTIPVLFNVHGLWHVHRTMLSPLPNCIHQGCS
jgi:hypothetical protein